MSWDLRPGLLNERRPTHFQLLSPLREGGVLAESEMVDILPIISNQQIGRFDRGYEEADMKVATIEKGGDEIHRKSSVWAVIVEGC